MHAKDAAHAALELTEQRTRIADAAGGVTDEAWATRRRLPAGPVRRTRSTWQVEVEIA
ncbi:hypothetical protein [Nonomuraea sp. NPDC049784]|uniref:hypothetical protein n=1 Tax=Nonomuraea sp. NPDC049784 TaxID=3154361 RepID=UPI00340055C6